MSASRPFQGDTGEGDDFSSQRAGSRGGGTEGRRRAGRIPFAGAKLRNPPRFRRLPPAFFCIGARWFAVLRGLCSRRASGGRKVARFSSSPPLFFRRSPALFSFGGRVALLRGVKCAVPRARVSRTRQPLFVFSLHRFTYPAQCADYLTIVGEDFAFSPSPRSSLPHGGRCRGRQVQRARSEISQFLLMRR